MIRALIVDDEPLARRRIRTLLDREADVAVVGECGDGPDAVAAIRERHPDVVFLDVRMPGCDGFDVIAAVGRRRMPAVVFVTAFDAHAVRAFEEHALDYLVKPFDDERFAAALDQVRARLAAPGRAADARLAGALAAIEASGTWLHRLVVKEEGRLIVVKVEDVDWLAAEDNYVRLHVGRVQYRMRSTLGVLAARLDPDRFLKLNRSQIVAIDRVKELQPAFHGEYLVLLKDGTRLVASRRHRDVVFKRLGVQP